MKQKYYHASPYTFKPGEVVSSNNTCYITTSPVPHYTIYHEAVTENWTVYEVSPIDTPVYSPCWNENICHQATVVRKVGNARGIANRHEKHFKVKEIADVPGSHVNYRRSKHI